MRSALWVKASEIYDGEPHEKSIFRIALLTLLAVSLIYACAPKVEVPVAPTSLASAYLSIEYNDATNIRSQLAYGTLKLADTPNAVTSEQAKTLIPLWQAVISLSGDTTTATEELTAVQDQITTTLTADQLQTIAGMQITNAGLNEFYAQYGITLPTPIPGVTKVPGTGQAAKTLLFEKTIEYLTDVSKQ